MAISRIMAALLGLCLAAVNAASAETRKLDIVGTGDGIDVLRAIAASFMQQEGSAQVEVPPSIGSGGGIAAVGSGKAILGRAARRGCAYRRRPAPSNSQGGPNRSQRADRL